MKTAKTKKLNFVIDFKLGDNKIAMPAQMYGSDNLLNLVEKMTRNFPAESKDVTSYPVKPTFILAVESAKKAREVADEWNRSAKENGNLYDFHPLTVDEWYQIYCENRSGKKVA